MSKKQEQFVVRICGCHRGLDHFINILAESRVDVVRVLEKIGPLDNKATVARFLDGIEIGKDRYNCPLIVESEGETPCKVKGSTHGGVVMPIDCR